MEKKQIIGLVSAMILICTNYAWPQLYPVTIKRPVTFYDFHSDGTNPEFERPYMAGIHTGMVSVMLGADKKPVLGPSPYLNYGIAKWFRHWQQGDFVVPKYLKQSGGEFDAVMTYTGMITINSDTSYKNFVIQDSLPFQSGSGSTVILQYSNADFFPLDGKGFGNEGKNHNYSFAMEFHDSVPCIGSGFTLAFSGSDDMWVYINNQLVVDLGGIHPPETVAVALDTVKGLTLGKSYPMDVYYSERHSTASSVIMSWIVTDKPLPKFSIEVVPPFDTVLAGDSLVLEAAIIDDTGGVRTAEFETSISWAIFPADNFCWVAPAVGSRVTFHGNAGYRTYKVFARFSPDSYHILKDSVTICIKPGEAYRLFVEPYPVVSLYVPNPVDSVVFLNTETQKEIAAVVRDKFGNFARFDSIVTWESGDSGIVKVTTPDKPYICRIEKVRSGTTYVVCKRNGSPVGTVEVIVNPWTKAVSPVARSVLQKPARAIEYFNLRGQKLENSMNRRMSGIIFERLISSDGSVYIRKINSQAEIRNHRTGGVE
jgi:fibro-slime domain-containing protein